MIEIDASMGEGGGQIVRTCLSLSMCTGRPITLHNIRAHRPNPGLRAQHLAAVRAAAAICSAQVTGDSTASHVLECLKLPPDSCLIEHVDAQGAGNALYVSIESAHLIVVFNGFGIHGVPAEKVAGAVGKFLPLDHEAHELSPGRWSLRLRPHARTDANGRMS